MRTPAQRAQDQLTKLQNYVDQLEPDAQAMVAIAKGNLRRWAETHGQAGDLALAMFQLERAAELQPVIVQ